MNRRAAQTCALLGCSLLLLGAVAREIPPPRGFVSDYAGVVDVTTENRLETLLGDLERKTGAQIAILTVRTSQPESAFDYSMRVAEAWKPGDREKDNGVVFLVAVEDRQMFIQVGYGLEGALPDGKVGEIRDEFVLPHFRRGDYASGIWQGTVALANVIAAEYGVSLSVRPLPDALRAGRRAPLGLGAILLLALLLLLVRSPFLLPFLSTGFMYRRGYWGGGFGGGGFGGGGGGFGGGRFGGGGAGGGW